MGRIKLICFDLDGVLVDMVQVHEKAFIDAVEECGHYHITHEFHMQKVNGLPTKKKLEKLNALELIHHDTLQAIYDAKQNKTILAIKSHLKKDASKRCLLEQLKQQDYSIACVTNSIKLTTHLMLMYTDLYDVLDFVVTNEDVRNPKPHPEPYFMAMNYFGVLPKECLIIEDSNIGFASAVNSGANVLRVNDPRDVTMQNITNYLNASC